MNINRSATGFYKNLLLLLIPTLLFWAAVRLLWPYFQYYIDLDAVSYLTLVKSYLRGDAHQAVNAYWSPFGGWLTTLWVQCTDWQLFAAAIFVNAFGSWLALISAQALFHKFRKSGVERWGFALTMPFFWAYVVYFQSFTDVWQCFFTMVGLLILLKSDFERKPVWWLLAGLIGALAYFSKAYSFYFFPLMIILVTGLKMHQEKNYRLSKHVLISVVAVATMLLIASPWLYLLHEKYGIWTTSTAGSLNQNWWLEGTQHMKAGITMLVPPPYATSLFYFEDPFLVQKSFVQFWDSPQLFFKFIARVGFNAFQWVVASNRVSPFYFFTWLLCILSLCNRSRPLFERKDKILMYVLLLFPLPFWSLTFDNGRFLWFTLPLSMIIGLSLFERTFWKYLNAKSRALFIAVFFLSFLVTPVLDLKLHFREGEEEQKMAQALNQLQIKGSFVSNLSYEEGKKELHLIAWFSGNPWYCHTLSKFSTADILQDARRYRVRYYFYFFKGTGSEYVLKDARGVPYPELTKGTIPGLQVFELEN